MHFTRLASFPFFLYASFLYYSLDGHRFPLSFPLWPVLFASSFFNFSVYTRFPGSLLPYFLSIPEQSFYLIHLAYCEAGADGRILFSTIKYSKYIHIMINIFCHLVLHRGKSFCSRCSQFFEKMISYPSMRLIIILYTT